MGAIILCLKCCKRYLYGFLRFSKRLYKHYQLKKKIKYQSIKQIFTDYYYHNRWEDNETVSGVGSKLCMTRALCKELPKICEKLSIKHVLDVPCGDLNWMKEITHHFDSYIGADVVDELIANNDKKYKNSRCSFTVLDLAEGSLPQVDLIICRDLFVHLSFQKIFKSLQNIVNSGSIYLATTTYLNAKKNRNIISGEYRILNLLLPPFCFPTPLEIIDETFDKRYCRPDKTIGIWKISDLPVYEF